MTFKRTSKPTFKARVEVDTPNHKGGHDRSTFLAEFDRSTSDELIDLRKLSAADIMRRKLVGWDDFVDDDNSPVEFNHENLESLISIPEALLGLTNAFWESVIKGREKN